MRVSTSTKSRYCALPCPAAAAAAAVTSKSGASSFGSLTRSLSLCVPRW